MSKYDYPTLRKAVELRLAGYSPEEVRGTTGIRNHSALELAEKCFAYAMAGGTTVELTPENVAALRSYFQLGWGNIMVMCATDEQRANLRAASEGKVRKAFSQYTDIDSRGIRIGKGGRWLNGDPSLYEDTLNPTGTEIPAGQARNIEVARQAAEVQKLMRMSWDELKELAKEHGIKPNSKSTPASLVARIRKAQDA